MTVQIVAIDLASRKLDLRITKIPERAAHKKKEDGAKGARFHHQADASGTRRGKAMHKQRKDKKHRGGFKQGRRGRNSR